ncbi:hypothetical protein ACQ1Q5_10550, partial [Ornithobacterium rhinotracheale]
EEILSVSFAVVMETAKRFYLNDTLEVTATPFDRDLSGSKDFVRLEGEDKAIWNTSWDAACKAVNWVMIPIDVLLIVFTFLKQVI